MIAKSRASKPCLCCAIAPICLYHRATVLSKGSVSAVGLSDPCHHLDSLIWKRPEVSGYLTFGVHIPLPNSSIPQVLYRSSNPGDTCLFHSNRTEQHHQY